MGCAWTESRDRGRGSQEAAMREQESVTQEKKPPEGGQLLTLTRARGSTTRIPYRCVHPRDGWKMVGECVYHFAPSMDWQPSFLYWTGSVVSDNASRVWGEGRKPRDWQQEHEEEDVWTQGIACYHGSMVGHRNVTQHQKCLLQPTWATPGQIPWLESGRVTGQVNNPCERQMSSSRRTTSRKYRGRLLVA